MKMIISLLLFVFAVAAYAIPSGYSTKEVYQTQLDLDTAEASLSTAESDIDTLEGKVGDAYTKIFTLDIDDTGTIAASDTAALSGGVIPGTSVITNVYSYAKTQIVSADDNTISLGCESAADLDDATDMTDITAGTVTAGAVLASTGVASYVVSDGCTPTITVGAGTSGITAGEMDWVIEFVEVE